MALDICKLHGVGLVYKAASDKLTDDGLTSAAEQTLARKLSPIRDSRLLELDFIRRISLVQHHQLLHSTLRP
jgi:hypothetical protein